MRDRSMALTFLRERRQHFPQELDYVREGVGHPMPAFSKTAILLRVLPLSPSTMVAAWPKRMPGICPRSGRR